MPGSDNRLGFLFRLRDLKERSNAAGGVLERLGGRGSATDGEFGQGHFRNFNRCVWGSCHCLCCMYVSRLEKCSVFAVFFSYM